MKTIAFPSLLTALLMVSLLAMAPTPAVAGSDAAVPTVTLKSTALVDGDVIYLGDLFDGTGDKAHTVVAYAPQPGKRAILDAQWLVRLARAHRINWQPVSPRDRVVVERNTIVIEREEIEDRIMAALAEQHSDGATGLGFDDTMRLTLSNRMMRLYMPANSMGRIGVEALDYDTISGRFAAIISAPEGDPSAMRHRVTGQIQQMVRVPVMVERLLAGEIIDENDIKTVWVPANRLQKDILTDVEQLVGKSPKRGLTPGRPIRNAEVRDPILVPRGGLVTIVLRLANMTLTSQGKALEHGSEGDVIRIINMQSNKTIQAVVASAGIVSVRAPVQELAETVLGAPNLQW